MNTDDENPLPERDYLSREEVTRVLNIRAQTLYAYVSRGWIRSVSRPGTKLKLYSREDVERILERIRARRGHGAVAAAAMRWGDPIIRSAITEITADGPKYRGRLALDLARGGHPFESVAELLWSGIAFDEPIAWEATPPPFPPGELIDRVGVEQPQSQLLPSMALLTIALGMSRGVPSERIKQGTALIAARQLIRALTGCFGFLGRRPAYVPPQPGDAVAASIARACGIAASAEAVAAIDAALILSADHELAPSTFAARVAASTSADLHSAVSSALCTHSGTQQGRSCDRLEELLGSVDNPAALRRRLDALQRSGAKLTGFNHPFYPRGDPRSEYLVELARSVRRPGRRAVLAFRLLDDARDRLQSRPSIEAALVVLACALGLPQGAAGGLFALGRCAGWVAHILEQRMYGFMLRPRAQFASLDDPVPD